MTHTLGIYKQWLETATAEQVLKVDAIYAACEKHYSQGGDVVCECFSPEEVLETFKSVEEVRQFCNRQIDRAKDARWGEDSDPELKAEYWEKE